MIVANTSTTQLGAYTVYERPRFDNPAWAVYIVFKNEKLIGKSFSRPDLGCCQWLERQQGVYATQEQSAKLTSYGAMQVSLRRRGRPRKADAERELQEALAS